MGVRPGSIKDMETDRLISPNRTLSRVEAAPFARTPTHRTLPGEPRCPVTWSRTTDWPPSGVAMPLTPRSLVDPLSHSNRVSPVTRCMENTQAEAPLHRRAQRGCGHVDKAAFRARGVQAAGNGAGEGSGERPSLQAGDWEDRNASAGVRTWREKQSGFTMGTAPGSERRSQPAQLPCPGRAPWGRRASGGSRNSLGPQRPLAAPADTLPQRTGCPLPPQF